MEAFTTRQIIAFVLALLFGGALTAWGTISIARYMLADYADPLTKQDGLKPAQADGKK